MRKYKPEQIAGLLFVLVLHGAALYGMWSYRILSVPEVVVLMASLVNPSPPELPEPPKPEPPKPRPPKPIELPKPQQIVAEAPVVMPEEPVVYSPPPPVIEAPPLPPQPVVLGNDLAVSCPERSPPEYPLLSRRANEQGRVVLRVGLGEDGRVSRAEVKESSGSRRLDEAALSAVKRWRCQPVMRNGVAVPAVALQPFNFSLVEN